MIVSAIQLNAEGHDPNRVLDALSKLIPRATEKGAELVCLPEHWLLEARVDAGSVQDRLSKLAEEHSVWLVSGANYTQHGDARFIESLLIGPNGDIVGRQSKVHLFKSEKVNARPGSRYEVFDIGSTKIGIVVCYDNVFPEVPRILAIKGAEILVVPSRIDRDGVDPWELYIRARALENRAVVVAPNLSLPPRFPGLSVIVDLVVLNEAGVVYPRVVARGGQRSEALVAELDLELVRRLRRERFGERRPETYSEIMRG